MSSEAYGSRMLATWGHIADAIQSSNTRSVAQYAKDQIITPSVAIEAGLISNPILIDALHTLNGIFSAYIMQAATRKLNVQSIETNRLLHSLATDRSKLGSAAIGGATIGAITAHMDGGESYLDWGDEPGFSLENLESNARQSTLGRDSASQMQQASNLGVGRILDVTAGIGENRASFQLMIQFRSKIASGEVIGNILSSGVKNESAKQRFHRLMAGELDLWRDVILLDDVIKADRQLRREASSDEEGMFRRILDQRRRRGSFLSLLSLNPNINELNNIFVISRSTFDRLQTNLGNLARSQVKRDEMFERSGAIFLAVVDASYGSMELFTHSFSGSAELNDRMIKSMGKGNDIDIMDIFKQFQNSNSLVF